MKITFKANPIVEIIRAQIVIHNGKEVEEYGIQDCNGLQWAVLPKEILGLEKAKDPFLFI